MAVPQEILVERGVVILEVEILLMKQTRIRAVMAGRTTTITKVEEQREKKYSKITKGIFPAQESWDSTGGITHLGCKPRGGLAVPQKILVERGVVILEVEGLLMKETRMRVAMAGRMMMMVGRTMTIAKVEEQRAKKYSKITNGMFM